MKLMKTTEAVGQVLCHDITQIIPGVKKDAVFRKGHIITKEDIPVLLSVGKDTIYIWENDETMMHENEAAEVLYRMSACGTKKIEADTQSGVSCGTVRCAERQRRPALPEDRRPLCFLSHGFCLLLAPI